ncbi:hypothetical protein BGW80DRAFT_374630 [Lactifluus volemus]|nr:hypothetical protein BGW80DRAFT_374630 [Lactifluus volemus]
MMGSKLKCISMISAVPSMDDMPGVDSLNITLHAPPRTPLRAPLERRSRVIARKLTAEDQVAASPTTTSNDSDKKLSGGKLTYPGSDSRRSGFGPPDGVAEGGESDGVGLADDEEYGRRRRAAGRGRHSEGGESKSPSPLAQGMETVTAHDVRCTHGMVLLLLCSPHR